MFSLIDDLSPERIEQIEKRMQKGALSQSGFLGADERLRSIIDQDNQILRELGVTHKQIGDRLECLVGKARRLEELARRGRLEVQTEKTTDSENKAGGLSKMWGQISRFCDRVLLNAGAVKREPKDPIGNSSSIPALVEGQYRVYPVHYFGIQECPFLNADSSPCRETATSDFVIEQIETNLTIRVSGLMAHLVRDHHFFLGSVEHRLDPEQAISLFGIQPGHDYAPRHASEFIWKKDQGTTRQYADMERSEQYPFRTVIEAAEEIVKLTDTVYLHVWNDRCVSIADTDYEVSQEMLVGGAYLSDAKIERGVWAYKRCDNHYIDRKSASANSPLRVGR